MNNEVSTNPTAEQIAAAQAVLAQAGTTLSANIPTDSPVERKESFQPAIDDSRTTIPQTTTHLIDEPKPSTVVAIDQARKQALEVKFFETINNPRFWAKESRYLALLNDLAIPVFDDRSLQQFYIHADSDLNSAAAKLSKATGTPAVLPTEEEIKAEAWKRYTDKLMGEEKKALTKQRREEAKTTGSRPVPVTTEEVQSRVDVLVARLRAQENA